MLTLPELRLQHQSQIPQGYVEDIVFYVRYFVPIDLFPHCPATSVSTVPSRVADYKCDHQRSDGSFYT